MNSQEPYEQLRQTLSAERLMDAAREKSGLSDFGDTSFIVALDKFLDCTAREARPHAVGLATLKSEIVRNLMNRLRFQDDLRKHPEILDEDVFDPIIIVGLPRSGTTKTHRMLGVDPNLLKTYMWQLLNPSRFSNAVPGQPDPRIAAAADTGVLTDDDVIMAAHDGIMAESVEEDWHLMELTFNDWYFNIRTATKLWHEWVMTRTDPSEVDNFQYQRSLFQYLQWQQGGRNGRRWVIKNTGCLAFLDVVLKTFPKATFVHIHRHPLACVPSLTNIFVALAQARVENPDGKFLGRMILDWESRSVRKYLKLRERAELDSRIFDVPYEMIRSNPMPVIEEVYRKAGHILSQESKQAMLDWEAQNEQHKHGAHRYSLEEFGLTKGGIDEAFREYIDRFIDGRP